MKECVRCGGAIEEPLSKNGAHVLCDDFIHEDEDKWCFSIECVEGGDETPDEILHQKSVSMLADKYDPELPTVSDIDGEVMELPDSPSVKIELERITDPSECGDMSDDTSCLGHAYITAVKEDRTTITVHSDCVEDGDEVIW